MCVCIYVCVFNIPSSDSNMRSELITSRIKDGVTLLLWIKSCFLKRFVDVHPSQSHGHGSLSR